jgi:hypothetical protein
MMVTCQRSDKPQTQSQKAHTQPGTKGSKKNHQMQNVDTSEMSDTYNLPMSLKYHVML